MTKKEEKELARVELACRRSLEARLERGDEIDPDMYGFYAYRGNTYTVSVRLCGENYGDRDGCVACLLGSIVVDKLKKQKVVFQLDPNSHVGQYGQAGAAALGLGHRKGRESRIWFLFHRSD